MMIAVVEHPPPRRPDVATLPERLGSYGLVLSGAGCDDL